MADLIAEKETKLTEATDKYLRALAGENVFLYF
jgi:hypothetical protein